MDIWFVFTFSLLWITQLWTFMYRFLLKLYFHFSWKVEFPFLSRSGIVGSHVTICLEIWVNCKTFLNSLHHFTYLPAKYKGCVFLHILTNTNPSSFDFNFLYFFSFLWWKWGHGLRPSVFSNIDVWWYKFSFKGNILQILICCISIFI